MSQSTQVRLRGRLIGDYISETEQKVQTDLGQRQTTKDVTTSQSTKKETDGQKEMGVKTRNTNFHPYKSNNKPGRANRCVPHESAHGYNVNIIQAQIAVFGSFP